MWFWLTEQTNAPAAGDEASSLRLFFGIMAMAALVVMWLWLYFRVKDRARQVAQGPPQEPTEQERP
jgi:hypothetical protein